jgi:hypothetical protein
VTTENIHLESQPTNDISLGQIQNCEVYTLGGRGARRSMIKLVCGAKRATEGKQPV